MKMYLYVQEYSFCQNIKHREREKEKETLLTVVYTSNKDEMERYAILIINFHSVLIY